MQIENSEILYSYYNINEGKTLRIEGITKIDGLHYAVHKDLTIPLVFEDFDLAQTLVAYKIALKIAGQFDLENT